jgi:hypothetical protein
MAQPVQMNNMGGPMPGQPMPGGPGGFGQGDVTVAVSADSDCCWEAGRLGSRRAFVICGTGLTAWRATALLDAFSPLSQESYCGPMSIGIGVCLCCVGAFPFNLLVACCPCDQRITTYRDGMIIHQTG